ncbi:LOW QUALITY PROTEIN: structure-specific endonuclease subunit SLX4 [Anoplopoma fimbria]|uniref:LOW QUALITY PROTEIN: structure-specific endonuclease subunit SLX4 n=1 Tax=Anoplopoma fimbria TaxID=229290 RepID=UPI0023EDFAF8|nr:LOW QUALITY PROTEIN: structure-specific endonuclease subunit SLX4 [Anoplopoma fimbria]
MDDSDQDFVDLCSKLLKRVRKKPGESRQPRKAEHQPSSQASDGDKRRRNNKREGDSGATPPVCTGAEAEQHVVSGGTEHDSGDAESSVVPPAAAAAAGPSGLVTKVLHRMQQFKRASPQKMVHNHKSQPTNHKNDGAPPPPPPTQRQDTPPSFSSGLHPEPQDSDEALALRLQQDLDREAAEAQTADLEDGGLFFCQICHRDLSHMTPEGRTQHLNRCLDESEESAPAPSSSSSPPPPAVPDCPICGKKFKSQKSRSSHLKRCSSDMGVAPAVLLQALQRQTEETQNVPTDNAIPQTGGSKRKGPSKPGLPARKKPRKKTAPMDEDTMVALALSSSMLEQEQQGKRESETQLQTNTAASHISMTSALKWRPDKGKGRGKRKKGAVPRPPPLLLVQDAEAALTRLQERVSALLLRSRAPSPPTPTRCPSSLPGRSDAAVLWQKSRLLEGASTGLSDFYTPELTEFITPWESATTDAASSSTINKPPSSVQPVSEGTPGTGIRASILQSSSQMSSSQTASSTSRALLMDLMELAEDGVTLTQCGHTASGPDKDRSSSQITNLRLSGFVQEESEKQSDLCVSGFLPEPTHTHSEDARCRAGRTRAQPGAEEERGGNPSVALSRLASDLSSMVNNPQFSDLQLQVDSGEVYFAHSFMLYARCPLLAEMVHESGFWVREEGEPAAQRVLMNDVPGQAVLALLQYLYTARCSIPASLWPHVLELSSRFVGSLFDLQELQLLCQLHTQDAATRGDEEDYMNQEALNQTQQALTELLRSMWDEDDEDGEGTDTDGGRDEQRELEENHQVDDLTSGDREIREEKVNEEELEEIYEFAATQRQREEKDSTEEEKVDEEEDGEEVTAPKINPPGLSVKKLRPNSQLEPDPSLDRSYNRLFSDSWGVYEKVDPFSLPSTSAPAKRHTPQYQQHQSPHKPSSELSGRTLLQSSASGDDDLSLSLPPRASNLPIPGQSPGQVGDRGGGGDEGTDDLALKRESHGPRSICVPSSPDSPQEKTEPELIVLSDSSEDMEVFLSSHSPSLHSPCAVQKLQSYTQIKPQPIPNPNEPTLQSKQPSSLELSPDDPPVAPVQSHQGLWCDQDPVDCSPEVSWLIPSTPVQPSRSSTTISTQTKSSMCRTQLFPKGDSSSTPPSVFSSPALPVNNRVQTSNSPVRVSAHVGPTEGAVPKLKLDETCSSILDFNFGSKRPTSCVVSKALGVRALPPCQPKLSSSTSSKQDTPLHLHPHPYSSTPLHTELHKAPALPLPSPLHSNLDKSWTSQGKERAPSESPEKTELGSFHLSPMSDPSHTHSSKRQSESSRQSQRSVESRSHNHTGSELKGRGVRNDRGEGGMESGNKDTGDEGEQEEAETGEADVAESSFQQSFMAMDEPPIAFNDSWGFDGVDLEANPGCFSLRLEDSEASSRQGECSLGQRDAARSSSSTDHRPSPGSHSVRLLNSRGTVAACSPSKGHSSRPSTSVRAQAGLSFTPSPPDPTNQAASEIINSLLDSKIWDSWEEEEEEEKEKESLPLSQRLNPSAQLKTPASSHNKRRRTLVPITPLPHYSDMDTPELKNKLNRFGVRPLPKRQMILKLKEIHQYTHQLTSSEEEEEAASASRTVQTIHPPTGSEVPGNRAVSCTQRVKFKEPRAPASISPLKPNREEEQAELLSASQGSNTSSTAASEESERSNPELCLSSDSDSDGGISASQSENRLKDRLRSVRSFILSDPELYRQILQYQPLVLSQLQGRLKAAGIRLGAAKLVDYLDSQCITFTTAKPGHSAPSRRRGKRTGRGAKTAGKVERAGKELLQP